MRTVYFKLYMGFSNIHKSMLGAHILTGFTFLHMPYKDIFTVLWYLSDYMRQM